MAPSPSFPKHVKIGRVNIHKFPFPAIKRHTVTHAPIYEVCTRISLSCLPSIRKPLTTLTSDQNIYPMRIRKVTEIITPHFGLTEFSSEIAVKIFVHPNINNVE
jgi:hypothetical protein